MAELAIQVGRIVSDLTRDNDARSRTSNDLETRLRRIERLMWIGIGAVIAIQLTWGAVIVAVLNQMLKKL